MFSKDDLIRKRVNLQEQLMHVQGALMYLDQMIKELDEKEKAEKEKAESKE